MKEETRRFSFVGNDSQIVLTLYNGKAKARVIGVYSKYDIFSCDASSLDEAEQKLRAYIKSTPKYHDNYLRRLKP